MNIEGIIKGKLEEVSVDFEDAALEDMVTENMLDLYLKPLAVKVEASKSLEEPMSLNTRVINLGRTQSVTLLACKTIYNSYREDDLLCLIRTGIIPNYGELLEATLKLLEVFRFFISGLRNSVDVKYINTMGMTMKEYRELVSNSRDDAPRCDAVVKSLELFSNYALYTLHYNILSGSTIIADPELYLAEAKVATNTLMTYLNRHNDSVDTTTILNKYISYRDTYTEVIGNMKENIAKQIDSYMNQSNKLLNMITKMEEEYKKRYEATKKIADVTDQVTSKHLESQYKRIALLYERQLIESGRSQDNDLTIKTLDLLVGNYEKQSNKLKEIANTLEESSIGGYVENITPVLTEVTTKVSYLLKSHKEQQDTIHQLKTIANDMLEEEEDYNGTD